MIARNAPAKVNLYLRVVGRRADGYHLLDSLVAFATLADRVEAAAADELSLSLDGPFAYPLVVESTDDNLVLRAAQALAARLGIAPRARLRLMKNIPIAAGLGGGSADAAAALQALNVLWRADLPESDLAEIAAGLGADVPMCLAGRTATVSGIGEQIGPALSLPACGLVLVHPQVPLPTADVFRAAARQAVAPMADALPIRRGPPTIAALAQALTVRGNDLTEAAVSLVPEIGAILAALHATPGCRYAAMSGSGAACFALYEDVLEAEAARLDIEQVHPRWWTYGGAFLG
jgi:4-diphosphocytidyl-2-C-methyl-D-erythritol kinase